MGNFFDIYVCLLMQCTEQHFNYTYLSSYKALKTVKCHIWENQLQPCDVN